MKKAFKFTIGIMGFLFLLAIMTSLDHLSFSEEAPTIDPEIMILKEKVANLERESMRMELSYTSFVLNVEDYLISDKIIQCESSGRPNLINSLAKVGKDIGYFQINTFYHAKAAKKLGLDINNPNDNILFGVWLMKKYGKMPWNPSKHCWQDSVYKLERGIKAAMAFIDIDNIADKLATN